MSYSVSTPCYNCMKEGGENHCKDGFKIQEAVTKIHESCDGSHQGSGTIVLSCIKVEPRYK